jgi:ABC-type nitrate/sulfonate/bicarbonate transport system substrate-binding protein
MEERRIFMATSSIYTTPQIDTPEKAKAFVEALEKSKKWFEEHEPFKVNYRTVTGEEANELWKKIQW